jgi:hypothetical protein
MRHFSGNSWAPALQPVGRELGPAPQGVSGKPYLYL